MSIRAITSAITLSITAAAGAQPAGAHLTWQVSTDGVNYYSWLAVAPGDHYSIRAVLTTSYRSGGPPSIGLAKAAFDYIALDHADTTDTFDLAGAYALRPSKPLWKLDAQPGPHPWGGVDGYHIEVLGQWEGSSTPTFTQPPKVLCDTGHFPPFHGENPVVLFIMDAIAGQCPVSGGRMITFSAPWHSSGSPASADLYFYTTALGDMAKVPSEPTQSPGAITIYPGGSVPISGGR